MSRRRILLFGLSACAVVTVLGIVFCPRPSLYGDIDFSAAIEDRNGRLLRLSLADDERYRLFVPRDEISEAVIGASLVYEDKYFRSHPGVDPGALFRSAWSTYVSRQRVMGGSTITMQLARLRFSLQTTSISGKLAQIARALQLERHYTKDEILEAYLNLVPYGGNIEGIGTAARVYFDKTAAELSLAEVMALVVIPQNPAQRNPASAVGYENMLAARKRLLAMWEKKFATTPEARSLFELPLHVRSRAKLPFLAPHFSLARLAAVGTGQGAHKTSLDLTLQQVLENRIRHYVTRHGAVGIDNASAMLIDYRTMDVLAAVGSSDFTNSVIGGQVDGTQAKRSPGSTLKPFVYALAIDQGLIHPMTLMKDAPRRYGAYTPENFDRGFMGPVFARDALVYSRNVPAVNLLTRVGIDAFHNFLSDAEVTDLKSAKHYGLASVLGGNELTMEELVRLYAMLANGGELRPLNYFVNEPVQDSPRQLISPEAGFLVLDMLRNNPRPDALSISSAARQVPIAWKTGTSYAYRDAWSVGVFGPYVLAVWVGNFDGSGNPAFVGREAAAPLFFEIADTLTADFPDYRYPVDPPSGLNLRKVQVCASTGDLPGRYCPETTLSWFVPGVSPIKVSEVHRAINVNKETGLRSCRFDGDSGKEVIYEFWPSDIARVFRKAGIAIRRPPPWEKDCSLDLQAASGLAPEITSPSERLTYQVRVEQLEKERLPLRAVTDADVESIYWFINERFIAKSKRDQPVFWQPEVGDFTVIAVDDSGRSDREYLSVRIAQ